MNKLYKVTISLSLLPLIIGCSVYTAWLATKSNVLMYIGLANIMFGFVCVLSAFICLIIYGIKNRGEEKKKLTVKVTAALFIMLINFPAALAIMSSVSHELSTYNITIINDSNHPITKFTIVERDKETIIGDIHSKDSLEKKIHFSHEGSVEYKYTMNDNDYSGVLFGYVTTGRSFSADIVITEENQIKIKNHLTN